MAGRGGPSGPRPARPGGPSSSSSAPAPRGDSSDGCNCASFIMGFGGMILGAVITSMVHQCMYNCRRRGEFKECCCCPPKCPKIRADRLKWPEEKNEEPPCPPPPCPPPREANVQSLCSALQNAIKNCKEMLEKRNDECSEDD